MLSGYRRYSVYVVVIAAVTLLVSGCASPSTPSKAVNPPATATASPTPLPPSSEATGPDYSVNEPPAPEPLPRDPIKYARALGGTSHIGKSLYFVIGASVSSERKAQSLLDESDALFGDMQSYMIVQRSDNFDGMKPGYWIVAEAYATYPAKENLEFCRRAFPSAYVKKATVLTSDPIPVYDELVP
jgi:hypothetical protein